MKTLSLIGIAIAAALLMAAPVSIQSSSESVARLALSQAEAQTVVYRRARRPRIYLAPTYYGAGYYGGYYSQPYYSNPGGYYGGYYGAPAYGYYSRQPVGGGGGQFYCSGNDPRCWW